MANCIPGKLTKLSILALTYKAEDILVCAQTHDNQLTRAALEPLILPIKVLELRNCHLDWASKAYHGLTDLRLTRGEISKAPLASILHSSPGLRVLWLGLRLEISNDQTQPAPMHLDNLELLVLRMNHEELGPVLRLLVPGSKPLSLSLLNPYGQEKDITERFPCWTEFEQFAVSSNIHRFHAYWFSGCLQLMEALSLMPTVRVLAIEGNLFKEGDMLPGLTLDTLYVLNCMDGPEFAWLKEFVNKCRAQKLIVWKYWPWNHGHSDPWWKVLSPDDLHTICPVVNIVRDSQQNPIMEWY